MTNAHITLIAGPTASGKSALALEVAAKNGGLIVNTDSMQVYAELSILTARPTVADMRAVPHALYGHVSATDPYSVGRWCCDIRRLLDRQARVAPGQPLIFVGGTGLYFRALLEGLAPIPAIPDAVRAEWRQFGLTAEMDAVRAALVARDPAAAAKLVPTDRQRHVRALEVIAATGRSIVEWQRQPGRPLIASADVERWVVGWPRDALYARAGERVRQMFDAGAVREVEALTPLQLGPECPSVGALGVAPIRDMLAGKINREAAIAATILDTRHYIKRQLTWLRRNMTAWKEYSAQ